MPLMSLSAQQAMIFDKLSIYFPLIDFLPKSWITTKQKHCKSKNFGANLQPTKYLRVDGYSGKVNEKNTQMNLFDIPGVLFNSSSWRTLNLAEKSEIYFQDYSLTPLMVFVSIKFCLEIIITVLTMEYQENYPKCIPDKPTRLAKTGSPREIACLEMKLFAEAAESIADGDLVDTAIHG